jgi:hypothetical protein
MANSNAFAVPQEKKHYSEDEWFEVKPDACWLYLHGDKGDEDTKLQGVMMAIERKYGLRASLVISISLTWRKANFKLSPRTWKSKFKQWGYTKNLPTRTMQWVVAKEKQRTEKGESITFFYKRIKIEPRTILDFKKRRPDDDDNVLALVSEWINTPFCCSSDDNYSKTSRNCILSRECLQRKRFL